VIFLSGASYPLHFVWQAVNQNKLSQVETTLIKHHLEETRRACGCTKCKLCLCVLNYHSGICKVKYCNICARCVNFDHFCPREFSTGFASTQIDLVIAEPLQPAAKQKLTCDHWHYEQISPVCGDVLQAFVHT
jgi:hypothetical protein